jgi:hypothetical protein
MDFEQNQTTGMTLAEAIDKYGRIEDHKWANEGLFMVSFIVPSYVGDYWINTLTGKPVKSIYINKDMQPCLLSALSNLSSCGIINELKTFDGCFGIRDVRGHPGEPSAHSYGIAIDINAAENPLGGESKFSEEFIKCFEWAGFRWGGTFGRKDPMHFTLGW